MIGLKVKARMAALKAKAEEAMAMPQEYVTPPSLFPGQYRQPWPVGKPQPAEDAPTEPDDDTMQDGANAGQASSSALPAGRFLAGSTSNQQSVTRDHSDQMEMATSIPDPQPDIAPIDQSTSGAGSSSGGFSKYTNVNPSSEAISSSDARNTTPSALAPLSSQTFSTLDISEALNAIDIALNSVGAQNAAPVQSAHLSTPTQPRLSSVGIFQTPSSQPSSSINISEALEAMDTVLNSVGAQNAQSAHLSTPTQPRSSSFGLFEPPPSQPFSSIDTSEALNAMEIALNSLGVQNAAPVQSAHLSTPTQPRSSSFGLFEPPPSQTFPSIDTSEALNAMDTALNSVGAQNAAPVQSAHLSTPTQPRLSSVGIFERPPSQPFSSIDTSEALNAMDTALNSVGAQNAAPVQSAHLSSTSTQPSLSSVGLFEQQKPTPISLPTGFASLVPVINTPSVTPSNPQSATPMLTTNPFLSLISQSEPSSTFINASDRFRSELSSNAPNAPSTTHSNPHFSTSTTNPALQKNASSQAPTNALSNMVGVSSFLQPSYGQGTQASLGPPRYIPIATIPAFTTNLNTHNANASSQYTNPPPPPASMNPLWQPGPNFAASRWWTQPVPPALFENYSDTRPVLPMEPPPPPRPFVIKPLPSQKEWWDAANKSLSTRHLTVRELKTSPRKSRKRQRYMGEEEEEDTFERLQRVDSDANIKRMAPVQEKEERVIHRLPYSSSAQYRQKSRELEATHTYTHTSSTSRRGRSFPPPNPRHSSHSLRDQEPPRKRQRRDCTLSSALSALVESSKSLYKTARALY